MNKLNLGNVLCVCIFLVVLSKHPTRAALTTLTSKRRQPLNSKEYGFTLRQGELFTFEVQTCSSSYIAFHYDDNTRHGMFYWYIHACGFDAPSTHLAYLDLKEYSQYCQIVHKDPPTCSQFWPYYIYWHGAGVDFGRGIGNSRSPLATIKNLKEPIAYMDLDGDSQWKLEIKGQVEKTSGALYYSPLTMRNIKITSDVLRQKVVDIVELCAVECREDKECMSFTYDNPGKICQQHSTNFKGLTNAQYSNQNGVNYYQDTNGN